jgi:SAM-dependent methyltransferase
MVRAERSRRRTCSAKSSLHSRVVSTKWPKVRPNLSDEQIAVMEDWYGQFLGETLPSKYGWIFRFNHRYAARSAAPGARTLEVGAGNGDHLAFEDWTDQGEYVGIELRQNLTRELDRTHFPNARVIVGNCQEGIQFPDDSFDRVLAIHVLEHLDNLPAALSEVRRVLKPSGVFSVVIPCEGGWLYQLGRRFTVKRRFERQYQMPYDWMISYDHLNTASEVMAELGALFEIEHASWFPAMVPSVHVNVVVGLTARPRGVQLC